MLLAFGFFPVLCIKIVAVLNRLKFLNLANDRLQKKKNYGFIWLR